MKLSVKMSAMADERQVVRDGLKRCWGMTPEKDALYCAYHDNEWSRPTHDERKVEEMFVLELFQAGLSWRLLLGKREKFRKAFDGFNLEKIAAYDETKVEELMRDNGIVRNKKKIEGAIRNARLASSLKEEYGSLSNYFWHFTSGKSIIEPITVTTDALSDDVSADLRHRGFKFVGSLTIFSLLQSLGIIYSHEPECFCYKRDYAYNFEKNKYGK